MLAVYLLEAGGEFVFGVAVLQGSGLLDRVGGGQRADATGPVHAAAGEEAEDQPRPVGVAGADRVDLLPGRSRRGLEAPVAGGNARTPAAQRGGDHLGQL